jgi:hypothetical protein
MVPGTTDSDYYANKITGSVPQQSTPQQSTPQQGGVA